MSKIGFYGAGHMAESMTHGLIESGLYQPEDIYVYNHRYEPTLKKIAEHYHIHPLLDEKALFVAAEVIILAVQPKILLQVLPTIRDYIQDNQVLVSVAAGVSLEEIEAGIGKHKIARAMPNTPVTIGEGMSSISVNHQFTDEDRQTVVQIFESFGRAKILSEQQIDAVIGVSGSSPAYVYLFIEALADGAVAEGMSRKDAYEFAAQAVLGAAKMVLETGKHPAELKDAVCSPGGTTIAAVASLEKDGFRAAVMNAVQAAIQKNRE